MFERSSRGRTSGEQRVHDLSAGIEDEDEIALLRNTPAAGSIGTCRYKLKKNQTEDFKRVIDVMKAHNVGYFFYNGGGDSADTCLKIAQVSAHLGYPIIADVWVDTEAGQAVKVARKLAELDRARYVSYSTGGMKNVTVQIAARDLEEMYSYVSEVIENIPGVERTQTMLIPGILKDVDDWLPPE